MATPKEIDQWNATLLFKLLVIKDENENQKNRMLDRTIGETKAGMSKEAIAWVEHQVTSTK